MIDSYMHFFLRFYFHPVHIWLPWKQHSIAFKPTRRSRIADNCKYCRLIVFISRWKKAKVQRVIQQLGRFRFSNVECLREATISNSNGGPRPLVMVRRSMASWWIKPGPSHEWKQLQNLYQSGQRVWIDKRHVCWPPVEWIESRCLLNGESEFISTDIRYAFDINIHQPTVLQYESFVRRGFYTS